MADVPAHGDNKETVPRVRLGLIGANIKQSRAPLLHRICGELTGIEVSYDLIIPAERGADFEAAFDECRRSGMRGVNITYPFKEQVTQMLHVPDAEVRRIGSINTVVFGEGQPVGYNTDFTGFIAGYRATFGEQAAGCVALFGAGGVGRAIAFALLELGMTELRIIDQSREKAEALARAVSEFAPAQLKVAVVEEAATGLKGADGVVNATPMGMHGYPGSAVDAELLGGQQWAFDAVYTPLDTEFLKASEAAGLAVMSGYELFFFQGVHAFAHFAGTQPPDLDALRQRLAETDTP